MLDDLEYINRFDSNNALEVIANQYIQLEEKYDVPIQRLPVDSIVFSGMGGSALAAQLSQTWPGYQVPFEIVRGYEIPEYVSERTLFIAASYSGNTEETLASLASAKLKKAHIICVSAGGKLKDQAEKDGLTHVALPAGLQPRFAVFYALKALVTILEQCGLVAASNAERELHQTALFLQSHVGRWGSEVATEENQAKQIAKQLMGKTPIVYAGRKMFPAAYKWKINFNENAKNTAWCNQLPEFNHNEFLGWTSHPVEKPFGVIDLISQFEHPRVLKRFEVTDRLLSGKRPKAIRVEAQGETVLEQLLWTVALGDTVSIYLALLNGVNPTPVDLIEKFKAELG